MKKLIKRTLDEKAALLAQFDKLNKTMNGIDAAKEVGIPLSSIYSWRAEAKRASGKTGVKVVIHPSEPKKTRRVFAKTSATLPLGQATVIMGTPDQIASIMIAMKGIA